MKLKILAVDDYYSKGATLTPVGART